MDEYYFRKRHVPAFGSWECSNNGDDDDFGFTECFETARQAAGLFRYSYSEERDLYDNHILTPTAMIVVPRQCGINQKKKKKGVVKVDDEKHQDSACVVSDGSDSPPSRRIAKAVDEDLYKISPDLLRAHTKKKRRSWCLFSCCLQPTCVY